MAHYNFTECKAQGNGTTLTQRVYETLREEIVTGEFDPGERLVRRSLGKRLGVSPMPVTEALHMLEVDGLVENRALYGSRVRILTIEDVRIDEVLREAMECQAARMTAEHAGDAELGRLGSDARQLDRLMRDGDPESKLGMRLHLEFHAGLAQLSGFERLADEVRRVWARLLMRLNWIKALRFRRVPEDWHQQLVDSIHTRDPDAAEAKMREHVRYGIEDDVAALGEYLKRQQTQSGEPVKLDGGADGPPAIRRRSSATKARVRPLLQ